MNEDRAAALQDMLDDKFPDMVADRLDEIVEDHEDDIIGLLEQRGWVCTKRKTDADYGYHNSPDAVYERERDEKGIAALEAGKLPSNKLDGFPSEVD